MFNENFYNAEESKLHTPRSKQIFVFPLFFLKAEQINKYSKDSAVQELLICKNKYSA